MERLAQIPPDWAKLHRVSAGAFLLAEGRSLASVRRVARGVLADTMLAVDGMQAVGASAKSALFQAVQSGGKKMQAAIASAIVDARDDARELALARLDKEISLLERLIGVDLDRPERSDGGEDASHGDVAGSSFSAAWTAALLGAVLRWADDPSSRLSLRAAAEQQDYRLRRIAATEVSRAYNDEHDEGTGWLVDTYKNETWIAAVVKRWDATLDRKVCSVCRTHDGEIVPLGTTFDSAEEPGAVHPVCRCLDTIIALPARLRELVPGRYTDERDEAA